MGSSPIARSNLNEAVYFPNNLFRLNRNHALYGNGYMPKIPADIIPISDITSQNLLSRKYIRVLPEYYLLETVTENSIWHDHQVVLDHVIRVYEGLESILHYDFYEADYRIQLEQHLSEPVEKRTKKELLQVATLLHDIAKVDTLIIRPDGTAGCPSHELIGAERVKNFSKRFGFGPKDEEFTERIVRYHGFISEILNSILETGYKEKYFRIFKEITAEQSVCLVLLMHADLLGADLEKNDKKAFNERISLLRWLLSELIS